MLAGVVPMQARLRRRTQADRRELAETQLLNAALRIVAERGTGSMTLADVGEAAGYSRGLPAHYFTNKDGLVDALTEFLVVRYRQKSTEGRKPQQGLEAILSKVEGYLAVAAEDLTMSRAFQVLIAEAFSTGRRGTSKIAELTQSTLAFFEEQLRIGIRRNEIRPDVDPAHQAVIILGSLRGIIGQALVNENQVDLLGVRDELLQTLRRALEPRRVPLQ